MTSNIRKVFTSTTHTHTHFDQVRFLFILRQKKKSDKNCQSWEGNNWDLFHGSTHGREQTQPTVVSLSVSHSEPYTQIVLICLWLQTALPFPFERQCIMGGQRPSALCQTQVNSASVPLSMSALLFEDFIIPKEDLFALGGTFFCFVESVRVAAAAAVDFSTTDRAVRSSTPSHPPLASPRFAPTGSALRRYSSSPPAAAGD